MIDRGASPAPRRRPGADVRWPAALASGILLAAAFPPLDAGWLAWIALLPFLWSLDRATPKQAAGRGYLAGMAAIAGIGWFTTSFGGDVLWMRLLPWVLFTLIEALFFVPVALVIAAILQRDRPWGTLLGVPAVWVLGEWLRGAGPLGFPFGQMGYALHAEPGVIQAARVGGVYMVSFLPALVSTGLYLILFRSRTSRRVGFWGLAGVIAVALWGTVRLQRLAERTLDRWPGATVVVAQGSVHASWDDLRSALAYDALRKATVDAVRAAQTKVDLTVWSESSIPGYLLAEPGLRARAVDVARATGAPLLTGSVGLTSKGAPMNSAVLLLPDGRVAGMYQKRRLVPFGEWVPGRHVLPLLDQFGVVERDEVPGSAWTVLQAGRLKIGVPICFESAAPEISRVFVRRGANLLAIITNDAWFGHTGMAEQHADVAILRAVETDRWVVRCGLTGISGFIDTRGLWHGRLPLDQAGALVGAVSLHEDLTPYVRYGDWFLTLCLLAAVTAVFRRPLPPATTA